MSLEQSICAELQRRHVNQLALYFTPEEIRIVIEENDLFDFYMNTKKAVRSYWSRRESPLNVMLRIASFIPHYTNFLILTGAGVVVVFNGVQMNVLFLDNESVKIVSNILLCIPTTHSWGGFSTEHIVNFTSRENLRAQLEIFATAQVNSMSGQIWQYSYPWVYLGEVTTRLLPTEDDTEQPVLDAALQDDSVVDEIESDDEDNAMLTDMTGLFQTLESSDDEYSYYSD